MFRLMRVQGESMAPTLNPGELVVVRHRAYRARRPRRGELVAARPAACGGRALVKRIAGLPHEQVEIEGRRWQLGEDQFFLIGDQVEHSRDSRSFGPVNRGELIGPVQAKGWPWKFLAAARQE